jgi:hypothetical protein
MPPNLPKNHLAGPGWSGQRGSNSRLQAWEACALPTELCPHSKSITTSAHKHRSARLSRMKYGPPSCSFPSVYGRPQGPNIGRAIFQNKKITNFKQKFFMSLSIWKESTKKKGDNPGKDVIPAKNVWRTLKIRLTNRKQAYTTTGNFVGVAKKITRRRFCIITC